MKCAGVMVVSERLGILCIIESSCRDWWRGRGMGGFAILRPVALILLQSRKQVSKLEVLTSVLSCFGFVYVRLRFEAGRCLPVSNVLSISG